MTSSDNQNQQPNNPTYQQNIVIVGKQKSVGVAFILAFLFGPLGLLYASVVGGIVMFFIGILVAFITLGFGLILVWIGCIIWAVVAVNKANNKIPTAISTNVNLRHHSQAQQPYNEPSAQIPIQQSVQDPAISVELPTNISLSDNPTKKTTFDTQLQNQTETFGVMRIGSFVGFAIVLVSTFCPLAHFLFVHKTIYQVNQPYGIILLLISVVGIIGCVFSNKSVATLMVWMILALIVLLFIAGLFKMNHYFNFMPFHWGSESLDHKIKFDWGWYTMCAGGIIALLGTFAKKPAAIKATAKTD